MPASPDLAEPAATPSAPHAASAAPTIATLAAWWEAEEARTYRPRDYMAREWIT